MSEPFLGEIRMVGFNFAPVGWALCNGQIMSIAQNTALFSLLGTTYGGNGQSTFALPNLQSSVPIHAGQGPGLSPYVLGQTGGSEAVVLNLNQLPSHGHSIACNTAGGSANPSGNFLGNTSVPEKMYAATSNATMSPTAVTPSGGNQPHENRQPFLVVNFIIALQGIFPSRN